MQPVLAGLLEVAGQGLVVGCQEVFHTNEDRDRRAEMAQSPTDGELEVKNDHDHQTGNRHRLGSTGATTMNTNNVLTFTPEPKQVIVGSLPVWEQLMQEYVNTLAPKDRLETRLRLSTFLVWVRKQQAIARGATNGQSDTR